MDNRARVLVLDDERVIADTLATILGLGGYETRPVYSGKDAIAVANDFRPDILLADHAMPGISGLEAAKEIQKTFPGCRVVMLSGQPLVDEYEPYRTKGFNFLLVSKPVHPDVLLNQLKAEDVLVEGATSHPRILNVDDIEQHRYSISRVLARAGFEVSEAATGKEAIHEAIKSQPELILLDIHLPDFSGYDVCKVLKEAPETAGITVVHITASDKSVEAALQSARVGADEYLTHPIVPTRLIHRIRELLQLRYLHQDV
jgi:CheY-like chemotaxis protein